jgi:hypothetical protein
MTASPSVRHAARTLEALELKEVAAEERESQEHQHGSGELFGSFAHFLADARADANADLRRNERLGGDEHRGKDDRDPQEADREADGELIQADADAETDHRQSMGAGQQLGGGSFACLVARPKRVHSEGDEDDARDVVGVAADRIADAGADQEPDEGHRPFESREQQRHPKSLSTADPGDADGRGDGECIEGEWDDQRDQAEHVPEGTRPNLRKRGEQQANDAAGSGSTSRRWKMRLRTPD